MFRGYSHHAWSIRASLKQFFIKQYKMKSIIKHHISDVEIDGKGGQGFGDRNVTSKTILPKKKGSTKGETR